MLLFLLQVFFNGSFIFEAKNTKITEDENFSFQEMPTITTFRICHDTLITTTKYKGKDEDHLINVQIKNNLFLKTNDKFLKINLKTTINELSKYSKIAKRVDGYGSDFQLYAGYKPNTTFSKVKFVIDVSQKNRYTHFYNNGFMYQYIFNPLGIIQEIEIFDETINLKRIIKLIEKTKGTCNCGEKLEEIGFLQKEQISEIVSYEEIKDFFKMESYDTSFINEQFAQEISLRLRNHENEFLDLSSFGNSYKYFYFYRASDYKDFDLLNDLSLLNNEFEGSLKVILAAERQDIDGLIALNKELRFKTNILIADEIIVDQIPLTLDERKELKNLIISPENKILKKNGVEPGNSLLIKALNRKLNK